MFIYVHTQGAQEVRETWNVVKRCWVLTCLGHLPAQFLGGLPLGNSTVTEGHSDKIFELQVHTKRTVLLVCFKLWGTKCVSVKWKASSTSQSLDKH